MIEEFLKKNSHIRLLNGDKWLVWGSKIEGWIVYQRRYGAHKTTVYYHGDLAGALEALAE